MKNFKILFLLITLTIIVAEGTAQNSIYQFKTKTITGEEFDMASLKGKKVLIVNTASKCGFTPQYKELQTLYKDYKDKNFIIIGFPANNFSNQEPGTNEEIKAFCEKNFGVTFPMMSKISVKGIDIDPIFAWLTEKKKNGVMEIDVKWNFQKFLINEKGELVDFVLPSESPLSDKIINWINSK